MGRVIAITVIRRKKR